MRTPGPNELADIAQMPAQPPMRPGAGQTVEIAEQDQGRIFFVRRQPVGTREQFGLQTAFAPAQTEVRIDDMHRAELRQHIHPDRGPLFAAEKRSVARETFGAPQGQRMPAENGVAIMFVAVPHRRVEMPMPAQRFRDRPGLIHPARSLPAQVEFLETDNIHRQIGDHFRDPRLRPLPVRSDATVNVVSRDP